MPRYWLAEGDDVTGPHDPETLARRPGFDGESLVCPADRDGAPSGPWHRASTVGAFSRPPARPGESPFLSPSPTVRDLRVIGILQERSEVLDGTIDGLRRDLGDRRSEIVRLGADLKVKDRTEAGLRSRIEELETRVRKAEALKEQLKGLREAGESQMGRIGGLQDRIGELGTQLESVQEELKGSLERLEGLAKDLAQEKEKPPPPPDQVPPEVLIDSAKRTFGGLSRNARIALIAAPVAALLGLAVVPSTVVYFMASAPAPSAEAPKPAPEPVRTSAPPEPALEAAPSAQPRRRPRKRRRPRPRAGTRRRKRAAPRPEPPAPKRTPPKPIVPSGKAKAIIFAKGFPAVSPFHSKCPKDMEGVADWNKTSWEKPRTISDGIACRRTIAAVEAVELLSQLKGVGRSEAVQALAADIEEWGGLDKAYPIRWTAKKGSGGVYRVRAGERDLLTPRLRGKYGRGKADEEQGPWKFHDFAVDPAAKTLQPLNFLSWQDLDTKSYFTWSVLHGGGSEGSPAELTDQSDASKIAPRYRVDAKGKAVPLGSLNP